VSPRLERALFWAAVVALLALHMLGFDQAGRPLVFGWTPYDLVYRVGWMALAAGLVAWMTTRLWPNPS
jgi:hypothetical protein